MLSRAITVTNPPALTGGRDSLIERCAGGDVRAFEELYSRHSSMVARLVRNVAGPREDLEDIVQEVFFQVHRSIGNFHGESKFTTWLYRLTVNVTLQYVKSRKHRLVPYMPLESRHDLASSVPTPERETLSRQRWDILLSLLGTISEKKRTVFVLHEIEGMDAAEIARVLGIPTLTVRTRLFYARKAIYDRLAKNPELLAGMRAAGGD